MPKPLSKEDLYDINLYFGELIIDNRIIHVKEYARALIDEIERLNEIINNEDLYDINLYFDELIIDNRIIHVKEYARALIDEIERLNEIINNQATCPVCNMPMELVRPGKHQCNYCAARNSGA